MRGFLAEPGRALVYFLEHNGTEIALAGLGKLLNTWWPAAESNRRRQPFQARRSGWVTASTGRRIMQLGAKLSDSRPIRNFVGTFPCLARNVV